MTRALILLLCPLVAQAAEVDHSAHAAPEPAAQVDHSAHTAAPGDDNEQATQATVPLIDVSASSDAHAHVMSEHGASLNFLILGERFEQTDSDEALWELQGWLGYDYDKLWLKTEGEYDTESDATERSEVQLLYSRAIAPFWDVQAGLRRDEVSAESRTYATIGLMGLAPYWFEIDAAAFVSEAGDLSARLEAEYELRFTQKLLLQPRLELNYSFADDTELLLGEGVSEASFGLRLRYEWRRELAPYLGVEWARSYGSTAALLRAAGEERSDTRVVAGLRFWY